MPGIRAGPFRAGISKSGNIFTGLATPSRKDSGGLLDAIIGGLIFLFIILLLPWGILFYILLTEGEKRSKKFYVTVLVAIPVIQLISMLLVSEIYNNQFWNIYLVNWCAVWFIIVYLFISYIKDKEWQKKINVVFTAILLIISATLLIHVSSNIVPAKNRMLDVDEISGSYLISEGHSTNVVPSSATSDWQREYRYRTYNNELRIRILVFNNHDSASQFYHGHINIISEDGTFTFTNDRQLGDEGVNFIWTDPNTFIEYYYSVYYENNVYVFVRGSYSSKSTWDNIDSIAANQLKKL